MSNLIACIGGFTFLAYLLGHQQGQAKEKRESLRARQAEQAALDACLRTYEARYQGVVRAYEKLAAAYGKAVSRLKKQRGREQGVGRN